MKKGDLSKLALMGLASGCFIAAQSPESATNIVENQAIEDSFSEYMANCPGNGNGNGNSSGTQVYQPYQSQGSQGQGKSSCGGGGSCGGGNGNNNNNGNQMNNPRQQNGQGSWGMTSSNSQGMQQRGSGQDMNSCSGSQGCGGMTPPPPPSQDNSGYLRRSRQNNQSPQNGGQHSQNRYPSSQYGNPPPQQYPQRTAAAPSSSSYGSQMGSDGQTMFPMSEKMLLPALNDDARARYQSMSPEGKALALQKASDDQAYPDKNKAVMDAYKEIKEYRQKMNQDGKLRNGLQSPDEMERHQRDMQMDRLREQMKQRMNRGNQPQ